MLYVFVLIKKINERRLEKMDLKPLANSDFLLLTVLNIDCLV